ncbi:MAG: transcriptional regulator [Rhodoferax sp.]|nr:transcriptional regulator [Rhodoferax sp.]MCF8212058.1 transcriptional regulator [Rhodoferax sp.]
MNVSEILVPWGAVDAALGLAAPIRDDAHHAEMLAFVDECFERFGSDDTHPIFTLVALVAERIREYEGRVHPWPDNSTPASRLAFLMEQHGLRQCDLPEVGAQSVVSAVLAGKRALNLRQTQALARRFSVPMEALTA